MTSSQNSIQRRLLRYIREHELMRSGDRVGVAVSGGADSVALLRLLNELRPELGIVLLVVHINHKLRGNESEADELFVAKLAANLQLEAITRQVDARRHATQNDISLEAAGRDLRLSAFAAAATEHRLNCIATGHTLDDQAETVLLKFVRGAWTRGLAGVFPNVQLDAFRIVRPLLGTARAELRAYLQSIQQPWREDQSNSDPAFTRNRVRSQLLPTLQRDYNHAIARVLYSAAEIARAEQQFWDLHSSRLWCECAELLPAADRELRFHFNRARFTDLHLAEQRRVIEFLLRQVTSPDFPHVEEVRQVLTAGKPAACLPGGWELLLDRVSGELIMRRLAGQPT